MAKLGKETSTAKGTYPFINRINLACWQSNYFGKFDGIRLKLSGWRSWIDAAHNGAGLITRVGSSPTPDAKRKTMPNEKTHEDGVVFWQDSGNGAPEPALYIRPCADDLVEIHQAPNQWVIINRESLPELIKVLKTLRKV